MNNMIILTPFCQVRVKDSTLKKYVAMYITNPQVKGSIKKREKKMLDALYTAAHYIAEHRWIIEEENPEI